MFVQNIIMYVVIVVFYGAKFKFIGPNTWNFTVYPFLDVFHVPCGLIGLKIPQMPILPKKTYFGVYILIDLLNFPKI